MNQRTRLKMRSCGTKATGEKVKGQSDSIIHFTKNSINNYFLNYNLNIDSSSSNNKYNNLPLLSKSPLVDSFSREVEFNSVGINSSVPNTGQLDNTEVDIDCKLGTKRKQVEDSTTRSRLYKRHCTNTCSLPYKGDSSSAHTGDLAAATPQGDKLTLSGDHLRSNNTPQSEPGPSLVPSTSVEWENGTGQGSCYNDISHTGVIPDLDDEELTQGSGNERCTIPVPQAKRKRKKGGNRKGSVHQRQLSYPVSDLSVLTAFRKTYNTSMTNTSLSRRSVGDYMLWNRASRALPHQD